MNEQPTVSGIAEPSGYKVIWEGDRCGFADITGKMVIPVMYVDAHPEATPDGFMVKTDKGWGVVDRRNKLLISFDWTQIERATKSTHGWDGYRCHSELKKQRYFHYSEQGAYQGNFPIKETTLPEPESSPETQVTLTLGSLDAPPHKITYLLQSDTTYTIVENQGGFTLLKNSQRLNWPTNWPDLLAYLKVQAVQQSAEDTL